MYLNGMGLRGIERVTEIHHTQGKRILISIDKQVQNCRQIAVSQQREPSVYSHYPLQLGSTFGEYCGEKIVLD